MATKKEKEVMDVEATPVKEEVKTEEGTKVPAEVVEPKQSKIKVLRNKVKEEHPKAYKWGKRIIGGTIVVGAGLAIKALKDHFGGGSMDMLESFDGDDSEEYDDENEGDETEE